MKKCPFCSEEIQDSAIKCRYCSEFLLKKDDGTYFTNNVQTQKKPWYFTTHILIIAFFTIGPFSLPLLWINPYFKIEKKIIISIIILIITYVMYVLAVKSIQSISEYYKIIFDM